MNAAFALPILALISFVQCPSLVMMLPTYSSRSFPVIIVFSGFITLDFSMFISISYFLPTSTILSNINCSPSSVLDITTRSSAYLMALIFLPPTVKSPIFSSASLTSHSP
uniref:Putative product n=1 Tax=Xenopsylla cheopis TaxID=163159 RepID=A0A6M2E1V2_XENCH